MLSIEKGYGLLTDREGKMIGSVENVDIDDTIYISLKDGRIKALVKEVARDE